MNREDLEKLQMAGPTQKFFDARLIEQVLISPDVIFKGLKREGFEDGYCYSKVPSCRWVGGIGEDPIKIPPPPDVVMLVFIKPDKGRLVFDWELRPEQRESPGHPENWESNFEERIWMKP